MSRGNWKRCSINYSPAGATHLVARRYLPKMIVTHAVPLADDGDGRGAATIDVAEQPNVFLAGDWVGPDAMLADAAAASAAQAAQQVLSIIRSPQSKHDREHVLYARR